MTTNPDQTQAIKRKPGRPTNAEIAARKEVPAFVVAVTIVKHSVRCDKCGEQFYPKEREPKRAPGLCRCTRCGAGWRIKFNAAGIALTVSPT